MAQQANTPLSGTTIGVISDTHGLLRPEAIAALGTPDLILHAGDIGNPEIIDQLRAIAPIVAVRGNNDKGDWAKAIPEHETIKVEQVSIHLLHILQDLQSSFLKEVQVVVSGHSHKPLIEQRDGILFLNPGSAGPRRFNLPVAIAQLHINGSETQAQIIEIMP